MKGFERAGWEDTGVKELAGDDESVSCVGTSQSMR